MENVLQENILCVQNDKQDFLVSATVYKARHLRKLNCDTFVMVSCNGKYKRTRIAYRTDNPYFNEYFSFSLHCSERKLCRKGIVFSLYRPSICTTMHSCIGEFHVDLNTVWEQENHAFLKKWAMFEPIGRASSNELHCGYLLIDLMITSSKAMSFPISLDNALDYDMIERNKLLPTYDANDEVLKVRFCFSVFEGEFVNSAEYAVRISYAGLKVRTSTSSFGRNCRWNEKLSFVGRFPTTNQIIGIDLLTTNCCTSIVKSAKDIHFSSLSKRINDTYNLPTFGPAWMYLYSGTQESQYVGKLLVSFNTEVLSFQSVPVHKTQTNRVYEPLVTSNYWEEQVFEIKLCMVNMQLFAELSTRQLLVYLSCADIRSKAIILNIDKQKLTQCHRSVNCGEVIITLKTQAPDYRHKYFVQATISNLYGDMKEFSNLFKRAIIGQGENKFDLKNRKIFDHLLAQLELDFIHAYETIAQGNFKQHTKLDQLRKSYILQQLMLKKLEITAIRSRLSSSTTFQEVSLLITDVDAILSCLLVLTNDDQNQYPDVLLHVYASGHSSVIAIARFHMVHYLQSNASGVPGIQCGKRCTILLRSIHCNHSCPDHCGCIYVKLDYQLQIGTERREQEPLSDLMVVEDPSWGVTDVRQQPLNNHMITTFVRCKIHVYQGRIFAGVDESEQCNVKLSILFEDYEMALTTLPCPLSSFWNETIDFQNVPFVRSTVAYSNIQQCTVIFILQDDKKLASKIAIGWLETSIKPLRAEEPRERSKDQPHETLRTTELRILNMTMQWIPLFQRGIKVAEILVSSEIEEIPNSAQKSCELLLVHSLPPEIVPTLVPFIIRVRFVGLRQMQKRSYEKLKKARILISIGDGKIMSGVSEATYGNSANFPEEYETCSVRLPENPNYWPLMIIKHVCLTKEKQMKIIGKAIVNASALLNNSIAKRSPADNTTIIEIDQEENITSIPKRYELNTLFLWPNVRDMIDQQVKDFVEPKTSTIELNADAMNHTWWTKFYDNEHAKKYKRAILKIFATELENVSEFHGFKDWSGSYTLHKVKDEKKGGIVKQEYGVVKSQIQIHSGIKTMDLNKQNEAVDKRLIPVTVELVVVVYVVQALNLTSRDIMSESDAYIKLSYGHQSVRDRAYYIPNQASPVFGRRFELRGKLPRDQILHLSVYDRDFASNDDLIGSTNIDIEDRFRSKHLPCFGLPNYFTSKGCNKWRHQMKPSEMLLDLCERHRVEKPRIEGRKIIIGKAEFEGEVLTANECLTEQLCLLALNNFKHVANGFSLTPEHVETRSLYHPKRGGIEQGKVQLWIELYEPSRPHPLPIDITPQLPKPYELRLIVWNTADVLLNERNIFGTEMSDIYVKCWLQEFTEAQYTDVHYRSLTGEGNFNWRMVFPFRYSPADGMLVLRRRKAFYEQYDTELKYPPVLTVQIWDNDSFSADDFLGTVDLNLTQLPVPASTADACTLAQSLSLTGSGSGTGGNGALNLFVRRRVRGWFPVHGNIASNIDTCDQERQYDGISLTGKIELELEILSEEDATQNPVGVGRKPPQHLPEPLRPEVSFNWLQQPAKTFNKLLWPRVRKSFIWIGITLLLCLVVYGLVINMPTVFMVRSFEQRQSTASSFSGKS
ncbi:myoferlin isoform X2 [Anopheles merus]|uniref:myoferlin isoform X2 n=1 Tax=Anopheles merus TaxID=30066 RepID=UPI001BE3D78E|nr:myoferlin isoform X2 [Anopheles merus]